ncbi:MAG: hypothetical protein JWO19_684 [Bryobacterales bacterium]|nr:hypothetical protein [Bryobacterales bacterium]
MFQIAWVWVRAGSKNAYFPHVRRRNLASKHLIELICGGLLGVSLAYVFSGRGRCFPKRNARTQAEVEDIVDIASEQSFPASDPPAY